MMLESLNKIGIINILDNIISPDPTAYCPVINEIKNTQLLVLSALNLFHTISVQSSCIMLFLSNAKVGRVLALYTADQGSVPSTIYGCFLESHHSSDSWMQSQD